MALFLLLLDADIIIVTLTNKRMYSAASMDDEQTEAFGITADLIRANEESQRKSQLVGDAKARIKAKLLAGELRGRPYTRQTPAWLTWNEDSGAYELIAERAAIVREIFERTNAGDGIDRIAQDLNCRRVETWGVGRRKADHWRGSYMRKILTSTAPIGTFTLFTTKRDGVTGTRRDEPTGAVPGMFPAAVNEALYWTVHRRFATAAPRGRNANHAPQSIVAGIIHCATCGRLVTRVSKGKQVYLVCSRANARAHGCKYLAVPYAAVETALRENAGWLIEEAPRGKNTAALDREIAGLVTMELHFSGEASDLADLAAQEKSPAARKRLREKETELRGAQARLRAITAQRDTLTTASVRDRLKAVKNTLEADTVNVVATNQALRQAISRIVLDPEKAQMELYWHHAPESVQVIHFYTRHMRWDEGPRGLSDYGPPADTKAS
jgi:hypothetical protein